MEKVALSDVPKEPKRLKDNIAVWSEFFDLTMKYEAVSLGVGVADFDPPDFLKQEVTKAMGDGFN